MKSSEQTRREKAENVINQMDHFRRLVDNAVIDIKVTPSQKKALDYSIWYLADSNFLAPSYRFRSFTVKKHDGYKFLTVTAIIDNGKPGTVGYEYPTHKHFFIGSRGKISAYRTSKRGGNKVVEVTGNTALIYA